MNGSSMKRILYLQGESPCANLGLAEACLSLTPKIGHYPTGELLLDVAGTEKLLGGEKGVLSRLENIGEHFHIEKTVVTDRPEWAKPLGTGRLVVVPPGQSQKRLFSLPMDRVPFLGEPVIDDNEWKERHRLVAFMRRVGLSHIHDFARLPPLAINRRFGKMGILLHQWTLGTREFPIPLFSPQEELIETLDTSEIQSIDSLLMGLEPILQRFCQRLFGRNELAKTLCFKFRIDSGKKLSEILRLGEPTDQVQTILKLLDEFLRRLSWDDPLVTVEISVTETSPKVPAQLSLFDSTENRAHDLGRFIGRLKSRCPEILVGSPVLQEAFLPEQGWRVTWPVPAVSPSASVSASASAPAIQTPYNDRPLFLFATPKPIPTPKTRLIPSERIETHWWESHPQQRAYFIVESPSERPDERHPKYPPKYSDRLRQEHPPEYSNGRQWIFTTPQGQWFLHGIF